MLLSHSHHVMKFQIAKHNAKKKLKIKKKSIYSISWDQNSMNKVIYVKQHNKKKIFNPSTVFSYQMLKPVFSYIDTTKSPHGYQDQSMKKWFYLKPKISSLPDRHVLIGVK